MKVSQIKRALRAYRQLLQTAGIKSEAFPHNEVLTNDWRQLSLAHVHSMLSQIEAFVSHNQVSKAYGYLGFVQGVLWANGLLSITELKADN